MQQRNTIFVMSIAIMLLIVQSTLAQQDQRSNVRKLLGLLTDDTSCVKAKSELYNAPPGIVALAVIDALQRDRRFSQPRVHMDAYEILISVNGAQYENGRQLIMLGLRDPAVGQKCCRALLFSPENAYSEVTNALAAVVDDVSIHNSIRATAMKSLALLGRSGLTIGEKTAQMNQSGGIHPAESSLPSIQQAFSLAGDDSSLRSAGAYALLSIAGPQKAILQFDRLSPPAMTGVLWAINVIGAKTHGFMHVSTEARLSIRSFVIEACSYTEASVRREAIKTLLGVYGDEAYMIDKDNVSVNPSFYGILNDLYLAETDKDTNLLIAAVKDQLQIVINWKKAQLEALDN